MRLTDADTTGALVPPDWVLFVRQRTLVARRLDAERRTLTGEAVSVADPVGSDLNVSAGAFSVSASGVVTYRAGGANATQLTWFDRSGRALGTVGGRNENGLLHPRLAPDGRRIAVYQAAQKDTDVWLLDVARTTRFTFGAGLDQYPLWSPDGSRILFSSLRKDNLDLYQKQASGAAGSEELLLESPQNESPLDLSFDGRFLLYGVNDSGAGQDMWVLPMAGDRKPFAYLSSSFSERGGQFAPDARWVASSIRRIRTLRDLRPALSGPGRQWQVSTGRRDRAPVGAGRQRAVRHRARRPSDVGAHRREGCGTRARFSGSAVPDADRVRRRKSRRRPAPVLAWPPTAAS